MRRVLLQPASLILMMGLLGAGFVLVYWSDGSRDARPGSGLESGSTTRAFEPLHNTGVRGRLDLRFADTSVLIGIRLDNARAGARYNTHLHRGSCRTGGSGGLQLNPVRATAGGTGSSRTRVAYGLLNPTFDHLVMVHRPDQQHILCADLPAVSTMKRHASSPGQRSSE